MASTEEVSCDCTLLVSLWVGHPHVTTVFFVVFAAKAIEELQIESTDVKCGCTPLESPHSLGWPHVTTVPSVFIAAKAAPLLAMLLTEVNCGCTLSESPP
mmetsp:Transcript_56191/g.97953  ORF Transcript_56191/g.97953 Transcript_56191/m.97953 type:complete len:100 (-) Transcript_56191:141-440(-)